MPLPRAAVRNSSRKQLCLKLSDFYNYAHSLVDTIFNYWPPLETKTSPLATKLNRNLVCFSIWLASYSSNQRLLPTALALDMGAASVFFPLSYLPTTVAVPILQ